MRFIIYIVILLGNISSCFAQNSIAQKMLWLSKSKPTTNLFVHFDKNVYSNNETVYFTGYLLKTARFNAEKHSVMALALIRDIDSAVIIEDKFLIEKGLAFGSINLPDSILTGNYHFLVFTDKLINGSPEAIFKQSITIKTTIDPAFKANMKIISDHANLSNQKILITATSNDNRFLPKPTKITYRYGNLQKSANTDASGQLLIDISQQQNLTDPNLYVKLKNQKDSSFINLALPQTKVKAKVKFYPEGGNLVNGLLSQIGWEVNDQQNMPIALKACLYKNNVAIDTIETSFYGIGKFRLMPEMGASYSVKLIHSNLADSTYILPKILEKGLTINLQNAVVRDTLNVYFRSNETTKVNVLIHNFNQEFINNSIEIEGKIRLIRIPLTNVPKGLMTLTILDSLERPLTERMFFAHHDDLAKLNISTDQNIYKQREKIRLKINLQNVQENGMVSISCIQSNRLELKNTNDIESYTYLNNEMNYLPVGANGSIYKDQNYLEQILLIKGWRRYTWEDLRTVKATDTISTSDSLVISGSVSRYDKRAIAKPLSIFLYRNENISNNLTDFQGNFILNNKDIVVENGTKMYAFLNAKEMLIHSMKTKYPYVAMGKNIIGNMAFDSFILPSTLANNSNLVLSSKEKAISLKEVVISKTKELLVWGANKCGDYVCFNKILNCVNHARDGRNTHPIVGKKYLTANGLRTYKDCNDKNLNGFYALDGIHLEKEFYVNDYKDPQEPAFVSTLYWNYGLILNGNKKAELEFYTSDIVGKFKVVVNGITNKDVVYGEHFFEVKAKINP